MKAVISAKTIKNLKPKDKPYDVRDSKLKGFLVRVHPTARMTYVAQYARGKRYTIGTTDKLNAIKARKEAEKKLAGATLGEDPNAEKKKANARDLKTYLDEVYEPWAKLHRKTGAEIAQRIRACFPELLSFKLGQITPWHIEKFRSRRIKAGKKASTVNRDVTCLKSALSRAVDWGIIELHHLQKVKPLKTDSRAKVRYLLPDEETRLRVALDAREEKLRKERDSGNRWRRQRGYQELPDLRAVPYADRLKPLVLLSLNTGIRQGEAFNLQWLDVDLQKKLITVEGSGTKTTTTRHIPLNTEALRTLTEWKKQSSGYVFPADAGGRLDNVNKSWKAVLRATKITGFRWHDLRHTFASNLVMAGVDLNTVRELLGHSDLKMTLRYAHLAPEMKAAAVEKLARKTEQARELRGAV